MVIFSISTMDFNYLDNMESFFDEILRVTPIDITTKKHPAIIFGVRAASENHSILVKINLQKKEFA